MPLAIEGADALAVAVTPTTVSAAWLPVDGDVSFAASIDEVAAPAPVDPNAAFSGLSPESAHTIEIVTTLADASTEAVYADVGEDGRLEVVAPPEEPVAPPENNTEYRSVVSAKTLALRPTAAMRSSSSAGPPPSATWAELQYRTFIPWETIASGGNNRDQLIVNACMLLAKQSDIAGGDPTVPAIVTDYGAGELTFAGDNRSFEPPKEDERNYRTSMNLRVDWTAEPGERFGAAPRVGETKVVAKADPWDVVATRFADTSNMSAAEVSLAGENSENLVVAAVEHRANDPFCPADTAHTGVGAINYNLSVSFNRGGVISVLGAAVAMPSHEAWVRWAPESSWTLLLANEAKELTCLVASSIAPGGFLVFPETSFPFFSTVPCTRKLTAGVNETQDRWSELFAFPGARGSIGVTKSGRVIGEGLSSLLPSVGVPGSQMCATVGPVTRPQFPAGVTPVDIQFGKVPVYWEALVAHALGSDGHIYTWGSNTGGALGRSDGDEHPEPTAVDSRTYVDLDIYDGSTLAVDAAGDVWTWGNWFSSGTPSSSLVVPTLALEDADVIAVEGRLVLDAGGGLTELRTWYDDDTYDEVVDWVDVTRVGVSFSKILHDNWGYFALDTAGDVWTWGYGFSPMTEGYDPDEPWPPAYPDKIVSTHTYNDIAVGPSGVIYTTTAGVSISTVVGGSFVDDGVVLPVAPNPLNVDGFDAWGEKWVLDGDGEQKGYSWQRLSPPPTKLLSAADSPLWCWSDS